MIPAVPGCHLGASRPAIQSASAAMVGPAKQQSSTKFTRLGQRLSDDHSRLVGRWCAETSVRRGPGHRDGRRGMIST